ncbi:MAG: TonB-dependent receptor [Chitinophagales bacterium]|nr:TonB-dependent receptor [Chitinophagales bacterium]MDW8418283.1 TonB-dependent receptor [Chitinophagales bacterium]
MTRLRTLSFVMMLCSALIGFSQSAELSGKVTDAQTLEPLQGATVKIDKVKGGITDASGRFKIPLQPGEYDLAVSFIGFKTYKEKIILKEGDKKQLSISLEPSAIQVNAVVTVSAYKKNVAKETVTTEVLSARQIQNTNSNDLGEVVQKSPGVLVQDGQISIRGGSSYSYGVGTRTAVLVDGLQMQSADLGEAQNKMVPLSNVKQVEVIKGASSVVYGSSALNGVVNVVTQWPADYEPKTAVELNFGFYDNPPRGINKWWQGAPSPVYGIVNFNYQQRIKQFQLVAAANITRTDGYLELSGELREQILFKMRYLHPKIEGLNFGLNGSFQHETSDRFFISRGIDSLSLYRKSGSDDVYYRTSVDPFVSYTHAKGHRITSNFRIMHIFRPGNPPDPDANSIQFISDNQYQYKWKNLLIFTGGIPFTIGLSRSNLYPGTRLNFTTALYGQLELNYKIVSLQGGLRYEIAQVDTDRTIGYPIRSNFDKNKPGLPVFRTGINVQAAKATFLRMSWGQGYRIPSIAEKYISNDFISGLFVIPNDTLKAETGWSLEIGLKQGIQIGKWMAYLDGAFYWQEYRRFIEFQVGTWANQYSNGAPIFPDSLEFPFPGTGLLLGLKALNVENARIAGYEIGMAGNGSIGPVGIQLLSGYTYTWPGKDERDTSGRPTYPISEFIVDMFKYNFKRVAIDNPDTAKLLHYRLRHLFRTDVEITYKNFYIGGTFNFATVPEKIPPLFKAASNILFGDIYAVDKYLQKHIPGDFFFDLRAGANLNEHFKIGFIVKNFTNRIYALRPGKIEPLRSYTLQLRYTF